VTQQVRELGIRQVLGASSQRMLWQVTGHAAAVGTGGAFIGVSVALWSAASLRPVLYRIEPRDVASFATAPALLMAVSAVAALVPARRVLYLNVAEILRRD
jgi:ABC-type antimicrobial peptide transport system permease subunit